MALNQPLTDDYTIEDIVSNNLYRLIHKLNKEGFDVEMKDLEWELFSRCESIGIPSERLYPNEYLPRMFGVHRGYNGGGIHGNLIKTEIDGIRKGRENKANRVLGYFEDCFWAIMKEIDGASEQAQGQPLEIWEKIAI